MEMFTSFKKVMADPEITTAGNNVFIYSFKFLPIDRFFCLYCFLQRIIFFLCFFIFPLINQNLTCKKSDCCKT